MAMTIQPRPEAFDIHEDAATEETEMMLDDDNIEDLDPAALEDHEGAEEEQEDEDEYDESSGEENIEDSVQADMDKLQRDFPGFHDKYRLIKRIGEGTSPTGLKGNIQY